MFDKIEDKCQAFDVAIALYTWLSHWYDGMYDTKYAVMSELVGKHKLVIKSDSLGENELFIYDELSEDNWQECWTMLEDYLNNKWNED